MLRALAASTCLLLAASAAAQSRLEIDAEDHGAGRFRVSARVPGIASVAEAQALLAPGFAQLCGGAAVTLGHVRFEASEPLTGSGEKTLALTQDVQCGDAAPLLGGARGLPTAADEALVRSRTLAYLSALDAGDAAALRAMSSDELLAMSAAEQTLERTSEFRRAAGTARAPRLFALDWQDDPQGARPGRYVAVDYVVDYSSGAVRCGYVAWRQTAADAYELIRMEDGQLGSDVLAALDAAMRAEARRKMRCVD